MTNQTVLAAATSSASEGGAVMAADSALPTTWSEIRLAPVIAEAVAACGWIAPTQAQAAVIPVALRGRDVAVQSRTGTGKTAAFAIPLLQRIVLERAANKTAAKGGKAAAAAGSSTRGAAASADVEAFVGTSALVLVPSVELCVQATAVLESLGRFISQPALSVCNLTTRAPSAPALTLDAATCPDILVSTPAVLAKAVRANIVPAELLKGLRAVAVDEADLLTSLHSMQYLQPLLPPTRQTILVSATLSEAVAQLKGALLHSPVSVRVEQDDGSTPAAASAGGAASSSSGATGEAGDVLEMRVVIPASQRGQNLKQFYLVATDDCSRHTLLYSLFRLQKLLPGKTLIFVEEERETYGLQHFLEQLGIGALVYDASLPVAARVEVLARFQNGASGVLICTDATLAHAERLQGERGALEAAAEADAAGEVAAEEEDNGESDGAKLTSSTADAAAASTKKAARKKGGRGAAAAAADEDASGSATRAGLSRGIDFDNVTNVILFDGIDQPSALLFAAYLHRVGRTARAGAAGRSFMITSVAQAREVTPHLRDFLRRRGEVIRPFKALDRNHSAALQYRAQSALANVTRNAAKKLRVATVASELSRSSYLATKLGRADTTVLKRIMERASGKVKGDANLRHVPQYMQLPGADETADYEKRVRASQRETRAQTFQRLAKRREREDPLMEVVRKSASRAASQRSGGAAGGSGGAARFPRGSSSARGGSKARQPSQRQPSQRQPSQARAKSQQ